MKDNGSGNTYGGTTAGTGNVISGNGYAGIDFTGSITIEGNYIGTDATGKVAIFGNSCDIGGLGIVNTMTNSSSGTTITIDHFGQCSLGQ